MEPYLKEIDTEIYHTKRDQIVFLLNTYHTNLKHLRFIVQTIIDTHNQSRWIDKIDLINDCLNQFGLRINHVEPTTNTIEIIGESEIDCRQMNEKSANLTRERTSKIIRENQFPQIFVSHSQDDENLKGYFNKIFASSPVKAVYEEYEQLISGDVTVEKIKQDIDTSNAVFVLLSENVERKPHTRDWIAFEAGYACAKRKEVWVFEPADEFGKLSFITPGLSHYIPIYLDDNYFPYLRRIIDSYKDDESSKSRPKGTLIECLKCHSKYAVHFLPFAYFRCPVCNEKIFIRDEDGKITTGSTFVEPEERLILYDPKTNTNVAVFKQKRYDSK